MRNCGKSFLFTTLYAIRHRYVCACRYVCMCVHNVGVFMHLVLVIWVHRIWNNLGNAQVCRHLWNANQTSDYKGCYYIITLFLVSFKMTNGVKSIAVLYCALHRQYWQYWTLWRPCEAICYVYTVFVYWTQLPAWEKPYAHLQELSKHCRWEVAFYGMPVFTHLL